MSGSTAIEEIKSDKIVASAENRQILAGSIFDIDPAKFKKALDRRKTNREALLDWLNSALKDGIDYGRVHINKDCKNPNCIYKAPVDDDGNPIEHNSSDLKPGHWSRLPSLFKPGAEKIQGYLGLIPYYPTMSEYEEAFRGGVDVKTIVLQCHLINNNGEIVAYGIGARDLKQNQYIVNNTFKMAKKSGLIDAVLSIGGLSEIYTQDLEDMNFTGHINNTGDTPGTNDPEFDREYRIPFGTWGPKGEKTLDKNKGKGTPLSGIPDGTLKWYMDNKLDKYPFMIEFAKQELDARKIEGKRIAGDPLTKETKKLIEDALDEFEKKIPKGLYTNIKSWLENGATEPEGQKAIDKLGKYCKIEKKKESLEDVLSNEYEDSNPEADKISNDEKTSEIIKNKLIVDDSMEVPEIISLLKDNICRDNGVNPANAILFLNEQAKKMFTIRTIDSLKLINAKTLVSCYNAGTLKYEDPK